MRYRKHRSRQHGKGRREGAAGRRGAETRKAGGPRRGAAGLGDWRREGTRLRGRERRAAQLKAQNPRPGTARRAWRAPEGLQGAQDVPNSRLKEQETGGETDPADSWDAGESYRLGPTEQTRDRTEADGSRGAGGAREMNPQGLGLEADRGPRLSWSLCTRRPRKHLTRDVLEEPCRASGSRNTRRRRRHPGPQDSWAEGGAAHGAKRHRKGDARRAWCL